ncbi:MAG: dephospho-CoA kinase [Lachnospiraceae bacterium]|nr:dephospho-CoA kinase [Lachnospiraceae bacterium]
MKVIGITGGIGSGKSRVLEYLKSIGLYVVEADKLAKELMKPGTKCYKEIIEAFGADIAGEGGFLDSVKLAGIVFSDEKELGKLNGIVHPAVKEYIRQDIAAAGARGEKVYALEAALLIEDGYREICDELWYIYADKEVRIKRLKEGRGMTGEKIKEVIKNQSSDNFYRENTDCIIDNSGDFEGVIEQINERLNKM